MGVRYSRFLVPKISEFLYLLVKTETNELLNTFSELLNTFSVSFVTSSPAPFSSGVTVFQIFVLLLINL